MKRVKGSVIKYAFNQGKGYELKECYFISNSFNNFLVVAKNEDLTDTFLLHRGAIGRAKKLGLLTAN